MAQRDDDEDELGEAYSAMWDEVEVLISKLMKKYDNDMVNLAIVMFGQGSDLCHQAGMDLKDAEDMAKDLVNTVYDGNKKEYLN